MAVFDVGEAVNTKDYLDYLVETNGVKTSVMQLARKYHGIGVVWEHRYYGTSLPFAPTNITVGFSYIFIDVYTKTEWDTPE